MRGHFKEGRFEFETFDLAGYRPSALRRDERGRLTIGGFTGATFTVMKVLEDGRNAVWLF